MYTITKRFGPYPASHRQHNHSGHCSLIHGHNWIFDITFAVEKETQLDKNGFVLDFGEMDFLKIQLMDNFDHTFLVNSSDPKCAWFKRYLGSTALADVIVVLSASAEGLAQMVYNIAVDFVAKLDDATNRGVMVHSVTCLEDEKNSATYSYTDQIRTI